MTQAAMSFMDHLVELRSRIVKSSIAVLVGAVVAFLLNVEILDLLAKPYENAVEETGLAFFRPTEAFSLTMRIALFGGLILASPVISFQLWRFVAPALSRKEKRYAYPMMAVFGVLFISGVLVGYWALETGLRFIVNFGSDRLEPVIGANFYLTFAMRFILAFGVAFEFPVFLFGAAAVGATDSKKLRKNRRWALGIILIGAAVITPGGDPLTLMLLSVPLYALYEITILAVRLILRK